mgnify:CR=1 FL=1
MTMNATRKDDREQMLRSMAVSSAAEWMQNAIENAEKFTRELKRRREQFLDVAGKAAQSRDTTPVSVISWFVNDISNLNMNWRLDLAANHAAALALTEKTG